MGGMGGMSMGAPPAAPGSFVAWNKNGLLVEFVCTKDPANQSVTNIEASFSNSTGAQFDGMNFQVAVPKYMQLKMEPASGNALAPGGGVQINQKIHVSNTLQGQKPLMMRLKLDYAASGATKSELVEVRNFPQGL